MSATVINTWGRGTLPTCDYNQSDGKDKRHVNITQGMAKDMWLKLKRWKKTSNYNPEMTKAHITGFCQKYSVLKKNNTIYNLNIARQKT